MCSHTIQALTHGTKTRTIYHLLPFSSVKTVILYLAAFVALKRVYLPAGMFSTSYQTQQAYITKCSTPTKCQLCR